MVVEEVGVITSDQKTDFGKTLSSRNPVTGEVAGYDLTDHVVDSVGVGTLTSGCRNRNLNSTCRGSWASDTCTSDTIDGNGVSVSWIQTVVAVQNDRVEHGGHISDESRSADQLNEEAGVCWDVVGNVKRQTNLESIRLAGVHHTGDW